MSLYLFFFSLFLTFIFSFFCSLWLVPIKNICNVKSFGIPFSSLTFCIFNLKKLFTFSWLKTWQVRYVPLIVLSTSVFIKWGFGEPRSSLEALQGFRQILEKYFYSKIHDFNKCILAKNVTHLFVNHAGTKHNYLFWFHVVFYAFK